MIPLDEVVTFDVITSLPTTGAAGDASAQVYDVYEDTTDTPILADQTLTKRFTGHYKGTFTASAANGFEVGKWYNVIAEATVGGIAAKAIIMTFRIGPAEATAGVPDVNVTHIDDDAAPAHNLGESAKAIIPFTVSGTPTSTSMDTDITGYADGDLDGREVILNASGGTADGIAATILTYTSTNGVITYAAVNTTAVSGDKGVVI